MHSCSPIYCNNIPRKVKNLKMYRFSAFVLVLTVNLVFGKRHPNFIELVGNKVYFISQNLSVTWDEAKDYCESMNMTLLSLETEEESEKVNEALLHIGLVNHNDTAASNIFWTSGNDIDKEGEFVWATGEKITFSNWLPNMPDNGNDEEHCIAMGWQHLGKWNDDKCCHHRAFICEEMRELCLSKENNQVYSGCRCRRKPRNRISPSSRNSGYRSRFMSRFLSVLIAIYFDDN